MKSFRASMMIPLFGLLASVAACSGQAPADGTSSTDNAVTVSAQSDQAGPEHGRRMGHGPASLLFAALHEKIDLTDAQRSTIKTALEGLKPAGAPPVERHGNAALAAAVRAGKIDVVALTPAKVEQVDHAGRKEALAKALTTLHATLNPEQRVALVAAMQKHGGKPQGEAKTFEGDEGGKVHEGMKGHEGNFGPMRMFADLDLTPEQQTAIKAQLDANKPAPPTAAEREAMKAKHEAMRKSMDARLQTFATDTFDATAFLAAPEGGPSKMFAGKDRMLNDLAAVVPLLTPAQREKLAAKIEKGPGDRHASRTKAPGKAHHKGHKGHGKGKGMAKSGTKK